jgi:hypothetical protein
MGCNALGVPVHAFGVLGKGEALSEYAPGRLIVINKETYRSGGVVANTLPTVHDRAAPLFAEVEEIVHCDTCSFVRDPEDNHAVKPIALCAAGHSNARARSCRKCSCRRAAGRSLKMIASRT